MIIGMPARITSEIRAFCKQIESNANPIYLAVEPAPESMKLECFRNVENFIAKNGGSIQYGWRIGEWAGVMLEAEFHAVLRAPSGKYRDVTPFDEEQILFLPDNTKIYEGRQVNNIRFALANKPIVHEFIDINNKIFEERNKGGLAEKHGEIALPANIIMPLLRRSRELFTMIYKETASPNSPCVCGSGLKYKKCCRQ